MGFMEFQAVVMAAGSGSRMTEMTTGCPKFLLPVGNMPLIWYPLMRLKMAGFQEAIVIVPDSAKGKIADTIVSKIDLKLDIVPVPDDLGTADSLRMVANKIKTDILVVSCDLISNFELHRLADLHRTHNASLTVLLTPMFPGLKDASIPGLKRKHGQERDIIGIEKSTGRLIFMSSEADFEEGVAIRKSVLSRHPVVQVYSKLTDAHLYIMKKWLVDYLVADQRISTIKGELLPTLVKEQFGYQKKVAGPELPTGSASVLSVDVRRGIHALARVDDLTQLIQQMSTWNDHWGDLEDSYHGDDIRCYALVDEDSFLMRINTLVSYAEINRQIPRLWETLTEKPRKKGQHITQVGLDSIVGEDADIQEKVSIRNSVVGNQCKMREKVKLAKSVVMDHVVIDEGCTITGSIICRDATVGKQCELKDCIVGRGQHVADFSKLNNEVLLEADRLMEI